MRYSELRWQPERTKTYLGSPSLMRLPDGALVATHDYFGPGCPRNHENEEALTSVYRSEDNGQTWVNVTHLMNAYWSNLFLHRGALYLLGVSQQYGSIVIRRSDDGGFTWTHPKDEKSGLLFKGGYWHDNPNYHCSVVPILVHDGRLYRGFEDCIDARWPTGFQAFVLSIAESADLLDAANWTMSNKLGLDPEWLPETWGTCKAPGWLEGNVVADPAGQLWDVLRVHSTPAVDKAAFIRIEKGGKYIRFDQESGWGYFPGGMSRFTIRRDPVSGKYLTLSNNNTDSRFSWQRNILVLNVSDDLRNWRQAHVLLRDESGLRFEDSVRLTGFQYVDWQFDGDDLIYLVRTAYRGAITFHDSNRITYHVLENYARYIK